MDWERQAAARQLAKLLVFAWIIAIAPGLDPA